MRFLEAWASFPPQDVFRLFVPAAILAISCVLPGRPVARVAAVTLGIGALVMPELGASWLRYGWAALWGAIAMFAGGPADMHLGPRLAKRSAVEAGAVGLLLGLGILVMLIVAIAGQGLPADFTRQTSYGIALTGIGLIHLMLGRDVVRGAVSFAAMGFGLQWLEHAARQLALIEGGPGGGISLIATAAVVVLCMRVAAARRGAGGSAAVSHAHDLHD